MRLFGKVDGSVDRYDRAWLLTCPFDMALGVLGALSVTLSAAKDMTITLAASKDMGVALDSVKDMSITLAAEGG